ncbi:MAG: hypothetical protein AB1705_10830 [Verrucomicrobiota bacterium]
MKSIVTALFVFIGCAFCHAQTKAESKFHDAKLGLTFPKEIKTFERSEWHRFDEPELGYSVAYNSLTSAVTVYVYHGGLKRIQSGAGKEAKQQFEQAKRDILMAQRLGGYRSVKPLGDTEIKLGGETNGLTALKATFEIARNEGETMSMLVLTGHKNHFVKLRCTYPKHLKASSEKHFAAFLEEFGKLLNTP